MVTFDEQLRALVETAKGERIAQALDERFAADPEDTEAWLAVFALEDHHRLRKESVWGPVLAAAGSAAGRIRDPQLGWEATSWVMGLLLRFDNPQHATSALTAFLGRHPTHDDALDELVSLVCHENGDYRDAWWCVDDLAEQATDPQRKARALVALALMHRAGFPKELDETRVLLARARQAYPALDEALLRTWAERSRCARYLIDADAG